MNDNIHNPVSAIHVRGLQKNFKGRRENIWALRDVTFSVQRGEVFGFLGPNGSGKTTTIKILMGLIKSSGGTALIAGHDAGSPASRRRVGYLPENPSFYDHVSAREYLGFIAKIHKIEPSRQVARTDEVLKLVDLWDARDRRIREYSKGMIQRLGLAQALIHDPDVLILDEPMSGLDPIGRALVKTIIQNCRKKGSSIFFSTHITSDVEVVCDRIGIILNGSLRSVESVNAIMTTGIMGYHVHYRSTGALLDSVITVSKQDLQKTIEYLRTRGDVVTLIDPQRKDLEAFFLDIVNARQ